ncbi:hypothetical protein DUNSADRAFT_1987, partial [Dunaliella salina]
ALATHQPASPSSARALLHFASCLLPPASQAVAAAAPAAAACPSSSGGSNKAAKAHANPATATNNDSSGSNSSSPGGRGGDGGRSPLAQWHSPVTLGWLSWVLPLLANCLIHTHPPAPPEDWHQAIELTRIPSPHAALELSTAALRVHPMHRGLWALHSALDAAAGAPTSGAAHPTGLKPGSQKGSGGGAAGRGEDAGEQKAAAAAVARGLAGASREGAS